jgi:tetratricopeptide (TPR) repeat protein
MLPLIPILIIVLFVVAGVCLGMMFVFGDKPGKNVKGMKKTASKEEAAREADRRLAKNPRDAGALGYLGNIAYEEENWRRTLEIYEILAEMPVLPEDLNQVQVNLRAATAAIRLGDNGAAHKYLVVARSLDQSNFEVNYQLGLLEFQNNNFEKAARLLKLSLQSNPEYIPAMRTLGYAFFKLKKSKEALSYIRKALEIAPNDKESLFTLAECYNSAGQTEQALKIYSHLRPDSAWGPQACLASGMINVEDHHDEQAVADFEIGLKHAEIKADTEVEIKYQLANAYLRMQDISGAMKYLSEVQALRDNYKNTTELVTKYHEMNANKNLQIYIMSSSGDFVALCRKIVMTYFPKAKVKITKTLVTGDDWADLVAEVDTPKWSDTVAFRFVRTQGAIGELVLRDFHSRLKDAKASKGICIAVGLFSDEAKRFTDSRLIDLIEKDKLMPILNHVDSKMQNTNTREKIN